LWFIWHSDSADAYALLTDALWLKLIVPSIFLGIIKLQLPNATRKGVFLLPTPTCGRDSLTSRIFSKCHASPEAAGSSAIWSAAAETLRTHGG